MTMLRATAPAKINLSLRVYPKDATGMHPLVSLAQSIGWSDLLVGREADEDSLAIAGADLPTGGDNLIWKAIRALRDETDTAKPIAIALTKRIPASAGLGGGSSDAAAALRLYAAYAKLAPGVGDQVASLIGADVAFCLQGGLRWMEGYGERLSGRLPDADDYWVVVAVPPFELSTPAVYTAWDDLGGPEGLAVSGSAIPPSVRSFGPLINDLYPAAVAHNPAVDDWRAELADRWDRPVLLSGSGPSLFAFFSDQQEAAEGVARVPAEARSVFSAPPISNGARLDDR